MSDVRARNWLFVCYPESMPADWEELIDAWGVTVYLSPVHDLDVRKDGTLKKSHYHGVICFDGNKSYGQVLALCSQLGCATVKVCNSIVNSLRYLIHLDSPDKAQYCISDVRTWGRADLSAIYDKTSKEAIKDVESIIFFINSYSITEFSELVDFLLSEYPDELFSAAIKNHVFLRSYLQSRVFMARQFDN